MHLDEWSSPNSPTCCPGSVFTPSCALSRRLQKSRILLHDQLLTMIFAQLTFCESLRDIESLPERPTRAALPSGHPQPHPTLHLREPMSSATRASSRPGPDSDAAGPRVICGRDPGLGPRRGRYAFDSTTISLCLSLSPGPDSAAARRPSNSIPWWICAGIFLVYPCSTGKMHDVNALDQLRWRRGFLSDGQRLHRL